MLGLKAQLSLTRAWTNAAYQCVWAAFGLVSVMADSAMQLWAGTARRAVNAAAAGDTPIDSRSPAVRSWYRPPDGSSYGLGLAWTSPWPAMMAWHDMSRAPAAWWLPPALGIVGRSNAMSAWEAAFAAAGLAVMKAWSAPSDGSRVTAARGQPMPVLEPQPTEVGPYSAYRTDGGHAAAQITVAQFGMDRADRPCQGGSPTERRNRRNRTTLH